MTYQDCIEQARKEIGGSYMISALTVRDKATLIYAKEVAKQALIDAANSPGYNTQYGKLIHVETILNTLIQLP